MVDPDLIHGKFKGKRNQFVAAPIGFFGQIIIKINDGFVNSYGKHDRFCLFGYYYCTFY